MKRVDSLALFDRLLSFLSGVSEIYRKTAYSPWLTRWLLENDPECVRELIDYVASLVPSESTG
jgi:hypothetical protein